MGSAGCAVVVVTVRYPSVPGMRNVCELVFHLLFEMPEQSAPMSMLGSVFIPLVSVDTALRGVLSIMETMSILCL